MKPLLRAELLKLRTTRTFAALAGAAIGTSLLITILIAAITEPTRDEVLLDVFNSDTSSLFIVFLALLGIGGEWRHRTITSSLLAAPDRLRFLTAKTLAFAAAGALLSVLIAICVALVGTIILSARDLPLPGFGEWLEQVGRNAVIAALLGAFAVGLGAIIRNQVVAVIGVLIVWFVLEGALVALVPEVGKFAPFTALPTSIADVPPDNAGLPSDADLLSPGAALLALLAWIAAAFSLGAVLLRRRDVN
jgi:ABC-type transport system involved in multi-copper enzyme maturation permease subunit